MTIIFKGQVMVFREPSNKDFEFCAMMQYEREQFEKEKR